MVPAAGCFMVNAYLGFGATGEFKITYLGMGPTEIRICFVLINCVIIWLGADLVEGALIYVLIFGIVALCLVVYMTQRRIWKIDMDNR